MATVTDISTAASTSAEKLGIQKFDIYGSSVDETSVQVDRGEPKKVAASNRASIIVRVWNENDTMGVTSTTDVDPDGIELALKTAYEASFFGTKDHVPDFSPEATSPLTADIPNETVPQAPVADLITTLLSTEKDLLDAHPAIQSVPYNGLAQRDMDSFYLNSEGALREEVRSYASVYLYSKAEEEGRKPRSAGAMRISRGLERLDIQSCLQETIDKTVSHLGYQPIPSGKYRVVFSPEAFLSLIGAFSNLFNAQSILDNRSLSTPESLGTQVASPLLTLYDDALHPKNVAAETFDGEGTPTRRLPLIVEGILTNFLHSAGTAKRMNAQPTGHANIGAKVTVSPTFYQVEPGSGADAAYALEKADNVVFIDDLQALHAGVSALEGSFSLPFDGWLLKDGEKISVESATVAGDIREVLRSIVFVEPELEFTPGGVCPRIWVDELSITGE